MNTNRLKNIFSFGRKTNDGSSDRIQVQNHSGEVHSEIKHPQQHGFASRGPIGSETYTIYQDGNQENGAVLIVAGSAPVSLSSGDSVVYNTAGVAVHLNGAKVTITGATELTCSGDIADPNTTTPSMQDMRDLFDSHTHNSGPPPDQKMN